MESKGSYVDGKKVGSWERFHPNGQLAQKGTYEDHKPVGLQEVFHENGQLKSSGHFKNNKKQGKFEEYAKSGQLEVKKNFIDGQQDGSYESYYQNGQLNTKGSFKHDALEGPFEMYTEVIVRLIPGEESIRAFLANVMKGNQRLKYEALADRLKQEISGVVESAYSSSTIDELFKDPLLYLSLEDKIQSRMKKHERQYGIDIIRVASVEFSSKEYEWLREKAGKVELFK